MMKAFMAILLVASISHAGDWYEKGNGGFIISCPNKPTQLLDLYELQYRFKDVSNQSKMSLDRTEFRTLDERFQYLLKKISRLNPARANLYAGWYQDFKQEAEFLPDIHLNPIGDVGLVTPEPNCSLRQIVFQRDPSILSPYRYTIDLDSWNALGMIDQAALLMHEFSYREFSQPPNAHETSEPARYFNALVNSQELLNMPATLYLKTLQMLNIVRADYRNNPVLLAVKDKTNNTWHHFPLEFDPQGQLSQITYESSARLVQSGISISTSCSAHGDDLLLMGVAFYSPNGTLLTLGDVPDTFPGYYHCLSDIDTNRQFIARAYYVRFAPDGTLSTSTGVFKTGNYGYFSYPLIYREIYFIIDSDSIRNVLIAIHYDANQNIESIDYWASACRKTSSNDVFFYNQGMLNRPNTFKGENLEQQILALPACNK